jgi:hypothetical protein
MIVINPRDLMQEKFGIKLRYVYKTHVMTDREPAVAIYKKKNIDPLYRYIIIDPYCPVHHPYLLQDFHGFMEEDEEEKSICELLCNDVIVDDNNECLTAEMLHKLYYHDMKIDC